MAAPDKPPTLLLINGWVVFVSMTIPPMVLMQVMASAPAFSTAFAITVIFATFGESLTMIGMLVFAFTSFVTCAASSGSQAKGLPCSSSTLGQDMLTSMRSGLPLDIVFAQIPKSFTVKATMLAMIGSFVLAFACFISSAPSSIPGLLNPTALIMLSFPIAWRMGSLWPGLGSGEMDFMMTAPAPFFSAYTRADAVVSTIPDARTKGFLNLTPTKLVDRFTFSMCLQE